MDFALELQEMRRKWDKGLRYLGYLPRPYWMAKHRLAQTYKDAKLLRKHGQIYYAALVQANTKMFEPMTAQNLPGNPGAVLYSTGVLCETSPEDLLNLADELYAYKSSNDAPNEWRVVVASIRDEHQAPLNWKLPPRKEEAYDIFYTALMFFRQHLPKQRLIGSIFPIIAAPEHCKSILVLPKRYWTKEMKQYYLCEE